MQIVVILAFAIIGTLAVIYREKVATLFGGKPSQSMQAALIQASTPGVWKLEWSPASTKLDGLSFAFGEPHYFTKGPDQPATTGQRIDATFRLDGVGTLVPTQGADQEPRALVRLYFQRKGDNMSGQGDYEFFRWWSKQTVDVTNSPGTFTISETIQPDRWTSVFGKAGDTAPDKFIAAVGDMGAIGMTFGGMFGGHGMKPAAGTADGAVRYTLVGFNIT